MNILEFDQAGFVQACLFAALGAGLSIVFAAICIRSDASRKQQSRLSHSLALMNQQKSTLDSFVRDERVPDAVKLSLLLATARLMQEDSCVELLKEAHAAPNTDVYPEFLAELQRVDPVLVERYEDVVGAGLFAMAFSSKKVDACLFDIYDEMLMASGKRRIIAAS